MMTKILTICLGLTFLTLGLIYGSPVEITFQPMHRIGILILASLIGLIFYYLIGHGLKLNRIGLKTTIFILTGLISLPYFWIGLWTVPQAIYSEKYPMLEDISEYENQKGERIIGQFMEISGSIHHSQNRKILYDFRNGIRISYLYPDKKINGTWKYHRFDFDNGFNSISDTTYTAEFENGKIIN